MDHVLLKLNIRNFTDNKKGYLYVLNDRQLNMYCTMIIIINGIEEQIIFQHKNAMKYYSCVYTLTCERPYICRHCGKAFSQNGTLKRHSQTCKAAYNKNNSNTNINNNGHNNNENRDAHFDQKFPMSTPTTHHQSSFIKNISNNITDPINLKPSNFSTLLCNPIDGLSDNEGQMNLSQSISNSNHVKTTLPTTMNSINTTMNIIENNKTNVNKLSNQYIYPELNEKQLHKRNTNGNYGTKQKKRKLIDKE
ncbi:putative c2h2 zinc finger protein [Schistosoma mansoni]|uniref:putative c2h2 zinc finger protein n=1 Tax=Schistosoma mansoni TaxID=6183 RepID=UPI0001A64232|nr:putative c2h2 zinc finger protein [Schistosoma mansoni]|eukprot:XP_018655318.1 putative c2h2 zinc finger protein [Schistosoma mansoni]